MSLIDHTKHQAWLDANREGAEAWGSLIEREIRRRILLTVATYAYEIADKPIMSDASWDLLAQRIDKTLGTCHPIIDEFFATDFSPMTGMWIHHHPELPKVKKMFEKYYTGIIKEYCERGVASDRRRALATN